MQFEIANLYHIYNRGNNKQRIFFKADNYQYFLEKINRYIKPNSDILAWCLMPNHFHFLIHANEASVKIVKEFPIKINALTEGFRLLLSSYSQGINKQEDRTGNLFQQKTRFINIAEGSEGYGYTAFQYIHQNPYMAGLVVQHEDWEFSSYREYAGLSKASYCNKELAFSLFDLNEQNFQQSANTTLREDDLKKIF